MLTVFSLSSSRFTASGPGGSIREPRLATHSSISVSRASFSVFGCLRRSVLRCASSPRATSNWRRRRSCGAAIKEAIAGKIQDADGIERVRAELTATFARVTLTTTEEGFALTFTLRNEAIASWMEPVDSEPGTTGWQVRPTLRKTALRLDPTNEPSAP
jgi:hypothetical protein